MELPGNRNVETESFWEGKQGNDFDPNDVRDKKGFLDYKDLTHGNLFHDPREFGYQQFGDEEPLLDLCDTDSELQVPEDLINENVPHKPKNIWDDNLIFGQNDSGYENLSREPKDFVDENLSHGRNILGDDKVPRDPNAKWEIFDHDEKPSQKPKDLGDEKMSLKSKELGDEMLSNSPKDLIGQNHNNGFGTVHKSQEHKARKHDDSINCEGNLASNVSSNSGGRQNEHSGEKDIVLNVEEQIKLLSEKFKPVPPLMIRKVLQRDDVNGDFDAASRCLEDMYMSSSLPQHSKREKLVTTNKKKKQKQKPPVLPKPKRTKNGINRSDDISNSMSSTESQGRLKFQSVKNPEDPETFKRNPKKEFEQKLDMNQNSSVKNMASPEAKDGGEISCRSDSERKKSSEALKLKPVKQVPDFEPHQVLIRGLNTSTSYDTIVNFAESKTKEQVLKIVKLDDETSALVTFEKTIDFQNAKEKMERRQLEGGKVTVHRVPVGSSICAHNLASNTRSDPRIGGEVTSIQKKEGRNEQTAVTFKDPGVMYKVSSSTSLELNNVELPVKSFKQPININKTTLEQQSQHDIAVAVDKDVMEFMSTTDSFSELKESLKVHGFTMTYTSGDTILYVAPNRAQRDISVNKERGIKVVTDFTKKFKTIELDVDKNYWDAVIMEISKLKNEIGKDKLLVKECTTSKDKVTIICRESASKELKKTFMDKIVETESLEAKKAYEIDTINSEQGKLRLLNMTGYKEKLVSEYCDVEFEIDEANGKATIKGPKEQCYEAKLKVYQELAKFYEKQVSLSENVIEMLDVEKVIERMDRELDLLRRMKQIYAVFYINEGNIFVTGINKEHADQASDLVGSRLTKIKDPDDHMQEQHSKHEIAVAVDKDVMEFISATDSFSELKESLEAHGFTMTYTSGDTILYVAPNRAQRDSSVNKERGIKVVTDFTKKFKTIELDVDKNHWDVVIMEISKLHNEIGKDKLLIKECTTSKDKVTIICRESVSKELKKTFTDKIVETESLEAKKAYEIDTINSEQEKIHLPKMTGYKEKQVKEKERIRSQEDYDISSVRERISRPLLDDRYNSIGTDTDCSSNKNVRRHILEHEIVKIETDSLVSINADEKEKKIEISGTKDGRAREHEALQRLTDSFLRLGEMKVQQPGFHRMITSGKVDTSGDIEHKHKCAIEKVDNTPQSEESKDATLQDVSSSASTSSGSKSEKCGNATISWKQGDIVTENVSIQVGSTIGKLYDIFIRAGGPELSKELKQHNLLSRSYVIINKTGNLPCNQVILVSCCKWDGGNGEAEKKLRTILRECLHQASKLNATSIAFPVIGTGALGFPYNTACHIMISEVINVTSGWGPSSLNDVRFVVFDQDAKLVNAFQQEFTLAFGKIKGIASRLYKSLRFSSRNFDKRKSVSVKVPKVQVLQGDLINETTDAIVNINATDMNMQHAGVLSKAIAAAAGPAVQTECTKLGPQSAGSSVITGAGKLKTKRIIHIVPGKASVQHIQKCLEKCLQTAEDSKFQSISIPACGTGAFKMSAVDSSEATFQAIANVCPEFKHLKQIRIVIFVPQLIPAFMKKLLEYETESEKGK